MFSSTSIRFGFGSVRFGLALSDSVSICLVPRSGGDSSLAEMAFQYHSSASRKLRLQSNNSSISSNNDNDRGVFYGSDERKGRGGDGQRERAHMPYSMTAHTFRQIPQTHQLRVRPIESSKTRLGQAMYLSHTTTPPHVGRNVSHSFRSSYTSYRNYVLLRVPSHSQLSSWANPESRTVQQEATRKNVLIFTFRRMPTMNRPGVSLVELVEEPGR